MFNLNHVSKLVMEETQELTKNILHWNKYLLLLLLKMPLLFLNERIFKH